MANLSSTVSESILWRNSLAERPNDPSAELRARFRSAFLLFRERAGQLAEEIRKDLPDLTVHDLTHLDALWEIGSIITGDYSLSPADGFVLGGAILLHDLAMSVAATEGGLGAIRKDPRWGDFLTLEFRRSFRRDPTEQEIESPDEQVRSAALFGLLRVVHAENAEKLAFMTFTSSDGTTMSMIDDSELKRSFGRIIGRIAASHWWSAEEVAREFAHAIGAPPWCPPDWTIHPLPLACVLRAADAAHLDGRRAPRFLKSIRRPADASERHWRFQERLNKPYIADDRLVYTTGQAFSLADAPAWWLCLETLRMVDQELRNVDVLLAESRRPRFMARRVAAVDSPDRLSEYVQTDGWLPVSAVVQVTDLPRLMRSIGGDELYGKNPEVAVRELIQNAGDAIRARRHIEGRDEVFGTVTVRLIEESSGSWLEVEDNGVGMSRRVLTSVLLDAGNSLWRSGMVTEEFPGLISSAFRPVGQYGIGFFSIFMIGDEVEVITRRSDAARKDTIVLCFKNGLDGRPIVRPATSSEQLLDGGTNVRVKLRSAPRSDGGILRGDTYRKRPTTLVQLCRSLAPAADFALNGIEHGCQAVAVVANDWLSMSGSQLAERMRPIENYDDEIGERLLKRSIKEHARRLGPNIRTIRADDGTIYGRAAITRGHAGRGDWRVDLAGVVTIGGLAGSGLSGICGILSGDSLRASRDVAIPSVPPQILAAWATEQARLAFATFQEPEEQAACAIHVSLCGGATGPLAIATYRGRWVSAEQISALRDIPDEIIIVDRFETSIIHRIGGRLNDNVFVCGETGIPAMLSSRNYERWPPVPDDNRLRTLRTVLLESIAVSWGVSIDMLNVTDSYEDETKVAYAMNGDSALTGRGLLVRRPSRSP